MGVVIEASSANALLVEINEKAPTPSKRSEGRESESLDHVGAAELGVSCVLVSRPVLGGALITGGAIKPGNAGMEDADQEKADGGAGGDGEEGAAHRSQAARMHC